MEVETADRTAQRRIATTDSYAEAETVVERLDEAFADEAVRRLGAGGIRTP